MESYRVVLANQPRLLRGLLSHVLAKAPDVEVVSEQMNLAELASTVEQSHADWVIVSLWQEDKMPPLLADLLVEHPSTCLLGMASDGSRARVRCPGAADTSLNGLSLDDLLTALRRKAR